MLWDIDIDKTLRADKHSFRLQVRLATDSERLIVVGASGAGKSLLLKAIAGLLTPDTGHIRLNGRSLFDQSARINLAPQERKLAYVFQDYALFPHLTVRQNVAFALHSLWLNPPKHCRHDKVEHWLEAFGLLSIAEQLPSEISGGQRQRTALARALVTEPQALLLDEPFSALDPALRTHMRQELNQLLEKLRIPLLLITHDLEDAKIIGGQLVRLDNGAIDPRANELDLASTVASGFF